LAAASTRGKNSGGTGGAPVKSGVVPDFVEGRSLVFDRADERLSTSLYGFGRDARNDRLEACATQRDFRFVFICVHSWLLVFSAP
jgi:hypothetical protein